MAGSQRGTNRKSNYRLGISNRGKKTSNSNNSDFLPNIQGGSEYLKKEACMKVFFTFIVV